MQTESSTMQFDSDDGLLPGADRDPAAFTLWWTSGDQQGFMFGGNYTSEQAALAAIPKLESEFRKQLTDDSEWDDDSTWSVEPPRQEDAE